MKFTLLLRGAIPPSGNARKNDVKWLIRESVDRQMRELWGRTPLNSIKPVSMVGTKQEGFYVGRKIGNYEGFAPVSAYLKTYCSIDITILDPQYDDTIGIGDVDNMVKTIIDGLTLPSQKPPPDTFLQRASDRRIYAVMDDDNLVRQVTYRIDRLLGAADDRTQAVTLVAVQISALVGTMANLSMAI